MRRARHRMADSRGAVAIVVSLCIIAIFGFTAISIDLGNAWQNKRQLVTASDAAALAAAQEYATYGNGCASTVTTYAAANKDDATVTACVPSTGAVNGDPNGYVAVTTEATVDYSFAPVIGTDSSVIESSTVARYGIPLAVGGVRPFGLCIDTLLALPAYAAWDPASGPSDLVTITYSKDSNPDACNNGSSVPGNWATIDFDGGDNSNADIQIWTSEGYQELVYPVPLNGDTGAFSPTLATELQQLIEDETVFQIPLFDSASDSGSNSLFNIAGFVSIQLFDFETGGDQAKRSLTVKFVAAVAEGPCCAFGGVDTNTRVLQICSVDPADTDACEVSSAGPEM